MENYDAEPATATPLNPGEMWLDTKRAAALLGVSQGALEKRRSRSNRGGRHAHVPVHVLDRNGLHPRYRLSDLFDWMVREGTAARLRDGSDPAAALADARAEADATVATFLASHREGAR